MYKLSNPNDDYLNSLFSKFSEFDRVCINLLKANNLKSFDQSLSICMRVDPRCTFLFLRKFNSKINPDYIYFAQKLYDQKIVENNDESNNVVILNKSENFQNNENVVNINNSNINNKERKLNLNGHK